MNTKKQLNNILNKFPKKTELQKVKLSQIDDIQDAISRGFSNIEFFEDAYEEARSAITKANDIVRFELSDPLEDAKFMLDELEQELKELGIDNSPELKELQKEIQSLESAIDDAESKNDRLDFK
jgi:Mg2+ and Co2+ transporter CorA